MAKKELKRHTARRNDRIELVLSEEEKQKIVRMAVKEGLPVSTYIRWKLLKNSA